MIQVTKGKKFLALVTLSLPFVISASDSQETTPDKDATTLQWACRGGAVAYGVTVVLCFYYDKINKFGFIPDVALSLIPGIALSYAGWFHEYEGGLKNDQKRKLEEKIEHKEQEKELHKEGTEHVSSGRQPYEDEQKEDSLEQCLQPSKPRKKKWLKDRLKSWLPKNRS